MTPLRIHTRIAIVLAVGLWSILGWSAPAEAQQKSSKMYRFLLKGKVIEGSPFTWDSNEASVLTRDGNWIRFAPKEAENLKEVSNSFRSYSHSEVRSLLQREFGKGFEVTGVGHYLVVHPAGQKTQWAGQFEEIFRSFQHYFSVRGWRPTEPAFPLVAVVFPKRGDFMRYAQNEGAQIAPGVIGYYSPLSNRVSLYDITTDRGFDWSVNAETAIHEATHQTAFNCGMHNRFGFPPRWVVEGLGVMFEAKGVWNSSKWPNKTDRIHRMRLQTFREKLPSRKKGNMAEMIQYDRPFELDPDAAYSEAWAMTFFLTETDPRRYIEYLRKTANQPNFVLQRPSERLRDFTSVFGDDLVLLEAKMLRFISELP